MCIAHVIAIDACEWTCARKQHFNITLRCFVEVVYYLKQAFQVLNDNGIMPARQYYPVL